MPLDRDTTERLRYVHLICGLLEPFLWSFSNPCIELSSRLVNEIVGDILRIQQDTPFLVDCVESIPFHFKDQIVRPPGDETLIGPRGCTHTFSFLHPTPYLAQSLCLSSRNGKLLLRHLYFGH